MIFSNRLDVSEKVSVVIRKHWLVYVLNISVLVCTAFLPLLLVFFLPQSIGDQLLKSGITAPFLIYMYTLFILILWLLGFVAWTTYFLDTWVVTNRRVIAIDQKTLFGRAITTLMLERIQDVTVDINGVLGTLIGFGTLTIHTAGEGEDIVIKFAAHPQYVKDRIIEAQKGAIHQGEQSAV